jgi:chlorobactene glucosyltransferase
MTPSLIVVIFISLALISMVGIAISNVLLFPRLKRQHDITLSLGTNSSDKPLVSFLIPARNEEVVIGDTLRRILVQDASVDFEVLVLDDHSDDKTASIIESIHDERLKLVYGKDLPDGWMGKSWACQQLGQMARGEILIFTDADVRWEQDALSALLHNMAQHKSDLHTVWPTQTTVTWSERIVVPLMSMVITSYLPIVATHYSPFGVFAAANGQCMAWRRGTYQAVGGHRVVANNVLDDVTLARATKAQGFRLRMTDGQGLVGCRMYRNWDEVRDGFSKNILAGYGSSVIALLVASVFHWLVFLVPWVMLLDSRYRLWGALLILMGMGLRALSAQFTQQRIYDAITLPLGVLLMTRIAWKAITWHYTGGVRWKGRQLSATPKKRNGHG